METGMIVSASGTDISVTLASGGEAELLFVVLLLLHAATTVASRHAPNNIAARRCVRLAMIVSYWVRW
jgi:hypothetical protein